MRLSLLPTALILGLSILTPGAIAAQAVTTPEIPYQGLLLQGGAAAAGSHNFLFKILDSTGTNTLYQSGTVALKVNNQGLYSVVLGDASMNPIPATLPAQGNLQLQVTIDGQLMSPNDLVRPAFQALSAQAVTGPFQGDVTGTQGAMVVNSIQGLPLDFKTTVPALGDALLFNGKTWTPGVATGQPGPAGPAGPTGATGPAGPAGPSGTVVLVSAVWTSGITLNAPVAVTPLTSATQNTPGGPSASFANGALTLPATGFYQINLTLNSSFDVETSSNNGTSTTTYPTTLQAALTVSRAGGVRTIFGAPASYNSVTVGGNTCLTACLSYTDYFTQGDVVTFSGYLAGSKAEVLNAAIPSTLTVVTF